MIYLMIGIIVGLIVWKITDEETAGWCALIATFALSFVIYAEFIYEPEYESYEYTTTIKEVHENQYYTVSTDGNSVSVWLEEDDGSYQKETFPEDKVEFVPTNGKAKADVSGENFVKADKSDLFWFFIKDTGKDRFTAVTIYVPEYSDSVDAAETKIPEDSIEESETVIESTKNTYCTECGAALDDDDKFCGGCGKKLRLN